MGASGREEARILGKEDKNRPPRSLPPLISRISFLGNILLVYINEPFVFVSLGLYCLYGIERRKFCIVEYIVAVGESIFVRDYKRGVR